MTRSNSLCALSLTATMTLIPLGSAAFADTPRVLFLRGADRSGGFLEASGSNADEERTEQLADINNTTTGGGNHGWGMLAQTLRDQGYDVSQITETLAPGAPATGQTQGVAVPLEAMDLSEYDAIVFGSNNAAYGQPAVDAVENYLRGGGGAVFISDANFGSNWADASASDQAFLDRLGLVANQDNGTYRITRNNGEFLVPDHPIFEGVNEFDGEGVTPATVVSGTLPVGVSLQILAQAEGQVRRNNNPTGNKKEGTTTPATAADAALVAGTIGDGRFVYHFDRNTFFNQGGAGTDLTRFDNRQFALNLFEFVTVPEPASGLLLALGLGTLALRRR